MHYPEVNNGSIQQGALIYSFPVWITTIIVLFHFAAVVFNYSPIEFGLYPRTFSGLLGIFSAPLIHSDFGHLVSNIFPLLVTGLLTHWFYRPLIYRVYFFGWIVTGLIVWVVARDSFHIGASGLLYSITVFLFVSGMIRGSYRLVAVSLLLVFLYGSMIWGIFPMQRSISWESHAAGSLVGLLLAYLYRNFKTKSEIEQIIETPSEETDILEEKFGERYWEPGKSEIVQQQVVYTYKQRDEKESPKDQIQK